jgi:hypothetical protein
MVRTRGLGTRVRYGLAAAVLLGSTALTAVFTAPARAQGEVRIVSGPIVELTDEEAILSTPAGPITVRFSENTRYEREGRGTLADIRPNQYVAITGRPTGDGQVAQQIRVFAIAQATVPPRLNAPMGGPAVGSLMTNATVERVDGNRVTVRVAGQTLTVETSPDTEFVRPEPATANDMAPGRRLAVIGVMGGDGVVQAAHVNIVGDPPVLLPQPAPGGGEARP